MDADTRWATADRISDRIVALVNEEIAAGNQPSQILAGQLLAVIGTLKTAPRPMPPTLDLVEKAMLVCLTDMMHQS